jgi:cellobiose dehydrogenase (acceptor)
LRSTTYSTTSSATSTSTTQVIYGQCGGTYWTGPTVCAAGLVCNALSPPWYYQCLP